MHSGQERHDSINHDPIDKKPKRESKMISIQLGELLIFNVLVILMAVFINVLLVKILWRTLIPYLFPKAVTEGYVRGNISWFTAFGIVLFLGILVQGVIRVTN